MLESGGEPLSVNEKITMPECWLVVVVEAHSSIFLSQKGHHTLMLIISGGKDPCLKV